MSGAFEYRPKFFDIRVKKPGAETVERKPEQRPCDHVDCTKPGAYKAPKSRDQGTEFWHFCLEHVSEYNKRWNYFAGMSDDEFAAYQRAEEVGHRPTWSFRASKSDQISASMRGFKPGRRADPFAIFDARTAPEPARPKRRMSRVQTLALETLQLTEDANSEEIRARYSELVKRWHPDSNGGDRSAEAQLQKVLKAYQVLKAGGFA